MLIDLRDAPLSIDEAVAAVRHEGAGGIVVFLGVVRAENAGRAVSRLDYSAYAAMARAEMKRIAESVESDVTGTRAAVLHRTGELAVGDLAVVCAVSAPHRAEAFEGCRALIDRVKASTPIWKREHGPDGSAWIGWEPAGG